MKQIVSNYTYSPTANCVTLTGVNIDADQLLLVVAPEAGRTLYNFASVTGSVVPGASTRVNLTASTAGLTASSPLVIYYDDQASATSVTGTVALDPASLIALENVTVTIGSSVTVGGTVTANLSSANLNSVTIGVRGKLDYVVEWPAIIRLNISQGNIEDAPLSVYAFYQGNETYLSPAFGTSEPYGSVGFKIFKSLNQYTDSGKWFVDAVNYDPETFLGEEIFVNNSGGVLPPKSGWTTNGWGNVNNPKYGTFTISYDVSELNAISGTVTVGNSITIGSCVTHGVTVANSVTIGSLPAISGTVTIGNFPATQTIQGTVTAKPAFSGNQLQWIRIENEAGVYFCERIDELVWKGGQDSTDTIFITYNTQNGGGTWQIYGATFGGPYYCGIANQTDSRMPPAGDWDGVAVSYEQPSIQQVTLQNSVTIGSCVTHGVTVANSVTIASLPAISGTVTASVTNSVTIGSLPVQLSTTTIGGTARLNVTLSSATTVGNTAPSYANLYGGSDGTNLRAILTDTAGRSVVTVSNFPASQTISGTVTATLASTTVTVSALPSGALTTRFGSVTTANLATLTAAVTNTSRKYLLAQNISAGTVTIGIGFSPTTTQGIQLTAGAGLSFDAFCPTGAVYWLGATTGANFTILEG